MTANQISQKTGISLPLVIYHLKKMQDVNVVKITNVGKNTKSHDMKFYTIDKLAIVILREQLSMPAKKSKSLFNSFSRIHRLATLRAVSAAAWFTAQFLQVKAPQTETISDVARSAPIQAPRDGTKDARSSRVMWRIRIIFSTCAPPPSTYRAII